MPVATPARCAVLALAATLAGCSSIDNFLSGDKIDYRNSASKTRALEVPPDLTQLARDPRYAPQGGVISAAATPQTPSLQGGVLMQSAVVPSALGKVRVEKQGQLRWLVAEAPPEVIYPEIKAFWEERGFKLTTDNPQAGVMETDWVENRAKLPNDLIRSTLGRLVDRLYDSGERDRFRTRLERGPNGTEIYLSHRGLEEIYTNELKDNTAWRPRNSDAQLESEMLARLLARLGAQTEATAKSAVAGAPEAPAKARELAAPATMEVDEPFDRAWRRVGLALDRIGFTVVDRDRSKGVYFVRYADPDTAKADKGWLDKLAFWKDTTEKPQQYRVVVVGGDPSSSVVVQDADGAPDKSPNGEKILSLVRDQLK